MPLKICVLASGSSGNSIYIASEQTQLLVDAGLPAIEIVNRLRTIGAEVYDLDGILITHGHSDHYRSAGTLQYRHHIPVFLRPETSTAIYNKRSSRKVRSIRSPLDIPDRIGDIEVEAVPVQHGEEENPVGDAIGFVLRSGQATVAIATDLGASSLEVEAAFRSAQAIVIESNYDESMLSRKLQDSAYQKDWNYLQRIQSDYGHLSNHQCADLLASIMTTSTTDVFLAHISENHHDPRRDNNRFELALETIVDRLKQEKLPLPKFHRTYRRGLVNGEPSAVVAVT